MKKLYILLTILIGYQQMVIAQNDTTISTFANVHQGWGGGLDTRTVVDTFIFPSDVSGYDQINLTINCGCPAGGCDPWDRFANLKIIHKGEAIEIARYMTPYGKACSWVVDVSDYRNLLTDTVILSSFVDTWVNPAWSISYDFEFITGTPLYQYIKVNNLWADENVVYGDTTKPITIDSVYQTIDEVAEKTVVRIVNTGHGQGNTDNAAEFSQKTHKLILDDATTYSHLLWRDDCSSNPGCSNQSGTWTYNRANWCPGKAVDVEDFDVTANVVAGNSVKFEYELQDYFNYCSPNNAGCVQGTTCSDCNYNYNGHTEPHYKVHIQLLQKSNDPELYVKSLVAKSANLKVHLFPNPTNGIVQYSTSQSVSKIEVIALDGSSITLNNANTLGRIDLSSQTSGIYFVKFISDKGSVVKKVVKQ